MSTENSHRPALEEAFENDKVVKITDPDRLFWQATPDGDDALMLEKTESGSWYPRPTLIPISLAADMLGPSDDPITYSTVSKDEIPEGRHGRE